MCLAARLWDGAADDVRGPAEADAWEARGAYAVPDLPDWVRETWPRDVERGERLLGRSSGVEALFCTKDGRTVATPGFPWADDERGVS